MTSQPDKLRGPGPVATMLMTGSSPGKNSMLTRSIETKYCRFCYGMQDILFLWVLFFASLLLFNKNTRRYHRKKFWACISIWRPVTTLMIMKLTSWFLHIIGTHGQLKPTKPVTGIWSWFRFPIRLKNVASDWSTWVRNNIWLNYLFGQGCMLCIYMYIKHFEYQSNWQSAFEPPCGLLSAVGWVKIIHKPQGCLLYIKAF